MLMLRRRWEYWVCAMALCKIGASIIPATIQLTSKDIAYRANSAAVKMLICVDDDYVVEQVEGALPNSPSIKEKVLVAGKRDGWLSFDELIEDKSDQWERPTGEDATQIDDIMLIYFTSGTTAMPRPWSTASSTRSGTSSPPNTGSKYARTVCTCP